MEKEGQKQHNNALEGKVDHYPSSAQTLHDNIIIEETSLTSDVSEDYKDPVSENYVIERSNNIEAKTFLVPEVWPKKTLGHNMRLH